MNASADPSQRRQDAAVCVALAVQCIEVFLNVYFRRLIESERFNDARARILADLEKQIGLEQKIEQWPNLVFNRGFSKSSGVGQRVHKLRKTRNALMHFQNQNETFEPPDSNVAYHGLSNTTVFDSLKIADALQALETAESFVLEIFKMQDVSEDQLPPAMRQWTDKWPAQVK